MFIYYTCQILNMLNSVSIRKYIDRIDNTNQVYENNTHDAFTGCV